MSRILSRIANDIEALELKTQSDSSRGKLWSLSHRNVLPGLGEDDPAWLLPTHRAWGKTDDGNYAAASQQNILAAITGMIASATTVVDLSSLSHIADGRFREAIIEGVRQAYAKGNRPLVRLLWGKAIIASALQGDYGDLRRLVQDIAAKAPGVPVVAALTNFKEINQERSWNHSKIVAADGRVAMVGGMNLWSSDYLNTSAPVTDLSMMVAGEAARDAQLFLNELWTYVQLYGRANDRLVDLMLTRTPTYVVSANMADQAFVKPIPEPAVTGADQSETVPILSVGRGGYLRNGRLTRSKEFTMSPQDAQFSTGWLWNLISDGGVMNLGDPQWDANNPGDTALRSLVRSAEREIVVTQQMLEFKFASIGKPVFDFRLYKALAERIVAGVTIDIVTSNLNVKGDYRANHPQHSWDALSALVYRSLQESPQGFNLDHVALVSQSRSLMAKNLSIKGLGLSPLQNWPGQRVSPSLHSKVIGVDDSAFYVGSQNAYPNKLLEYGYIVESAKASSDLNRVFLDPLNQFSRPMAVNNKSNFLKLLPRNETFNGGSGHDLFNAADGDDTIVGSAGDDRFRGGLGRDRITGGPGADAFHYSDLNESRANGRRRDQITDFEVGIDKIDLSLIDANRVLVGHQPAIWKGLAPFSGVAGELSCLQQGKNLIVRIDANGDRVSDFEIALNNVDYSDRVAASIVVG